MDLQKKVSSSLPSLHPVLEDGPVAVGADIQVDRVLGRAGT